MEDMMCPSSKRTNKGALTSTPAGPREIPCIIDSDGKTTDESYASGSAQDSYGTPAVAKKTYQSLDLEKNRLTPRKPESKSIELGIIMETTVRWDRAARLAGVIKRG